MLENDFDVGQILLEVVEVRRGPTRATVSPEIARNDVPSASHDMRYEMPVSPAMFAGAMDDQQ